MALGRMCEGCAQTVLLLVAGVVPSMIHHVFCTLSMYLYEGTPHGTSIKRYERRCPFNIEKEGKVEFGVFISDYFLYQ